jgi:DNA invertase Pin-like site-specific DNA recombinase
VAGESKAKVIPLHSNSGRSAASRRAAAQRVDRSRRHPSLIGDADGRATAEELAAVVRDIDAHRAGGAITAEETPTELATKIGAVADFIRKRMTGDYTVDEFAFLC